MHFSILKMVYAFLISFQLSSTVFTMEQATLNRLHSVFGGVF
jgi:hypothetical protein